ncbi:MAG TPA: ExeM/NucH family extracellular endonuclease [Blastocatellia bacterium]|nr:ExeM/NucH family extracellular endonuclease [Blastocatellia bacterium]
MPLSSYQFRNLFRSRSAGASPQAGSSPRPSRKKWFAFLIGFFILSLIIALFPGWLRSSSALTNNGIITTFGSAIQEDFNTLSASGTGNAWVDNTTIAGWYSTRTTYNADAGSSTTGSLYSYGSAAVPADRALGSVASGTTGTIYYAVKLTNSTGSAINSLVVKYTGEQWRNGGNTSAQTLSFQYQIQNPGTITGANTPTTGWSNFTTLDFTSPITGATAAALDGNAAANRTLKEATLPVTINNGQEVWLRWVDINDTGNDHGLAIDDLSVRAYATNQPVVPTCPASLTANTGMATSGAVSATDADGKVTGATITSITPSDPGTISLSGFTPASTIGGTATASLDVGAGTPAGTYTVNLQWSNNDSPAAQTAACAVTVMVNNPPLVPSCPSPLNLLAGTAGSVNVSATDSNGVVTSAMITGITPSNPGTITLDNFVPAGAAGGTATATLNVGSATPVGNYAVMITWANNDSPTPQTASCTVNVNVSTNAPVTPTCPGTLTTIFGIATSGSVSASDSDGVVTSAMITGITPSNPGTITLDGFTPAGAVGGTATATLNVGSSTPVGNYAVTIKWSNNDSPTPQTGSCTVNVTVNTNAAVMPNCPASLNTFAGEAGSAGVSATDSDGKVTSATINGITPSDPGTITLSGFTPAGSVGGTATATLNVGATTPAGTYAVTIRWSNDDSPTPQTADCTVSVKVTPITLIHSIQGANETPAMTGAVTIRGIVVGDFQGAGKLSGFFVEEEQSDWDADPNTSEGIFIFDPSTLANVSVGDQVTVSGTISNFGGPPGLTELSSVTSVVVNSTGNPLPPAQSVTLPLPTSPAADLEKYEGMLVTFSTLYVADNGDLGRFGELTLAASRLFIPTNSIDPNDNPASGTSVTGNSNVAAVTAQQTTNNNSRIILNDGSTGSNPNPIPFIGAGTNATVRLGDSVTGLTGVMDFAFGSYRIEPTAVPAFNALNPRPAAPDPVGGTLRVASFNIENYFVTTGSRGASNATELARQRDKIVAALAGLDADVIGLIELEKGTQANPNAAVNDIVTALNALGTAGTYNFIPTPAAVYDPINPVGTDQDIKSGIIYRTSTVTQSGSVLTDTAAPTGTYSRAPIAQTFQSIANGGKFTVVVNHLRSKGCEGSSGADADQGDGQSCFNARRRNQAQALVSFINNTLVPLDPDVIAVGDFNSYAQEDPIDALRAAGLADLIPSDTQYSFNFNGELGRLDHAFATASLNAQVTGATIWHINADEPVVFDYNKENKPDDRYAATPYHSSDHNPLVIGLNLTTPVLTINSVSQPEGNGPTSSLTFTVTLSQSPDSDVTMSYATADGSATTAGNDYTAQSGMLTFAARTTTLTQTITVVVNPDCVIEPDENFTVTLSNPVNAALDMSQSVGTGTLTNDDAAGAIQIEMASYSVTEGGTATIKIIRSGGNAEVSADYKITGLTALEGADYTAAAYTGTVSFGCNETMKQITIQTVDDNIDEPNETVGIALSKPTGGAALGNPAEATLTITDNDPEPTVSINDATTTEGDSGTKPLTFDVMLSNPSSQTITFSFATANGTAMAGSDYIAAGGPLVFAPGETSKQITVTIIGDMIPEGTETFFVEINQAPAQQAVSGISAGEGAAEAPSAVTPLARGTGTITDDDGGINAPGLFDPAGSEATDQKPGSVLIFPVYTSSLSNPAAENTRLSLTNISPDRNAFVHLFFVDGSSCTVADSFVCLTANQTMMINAADVDPGVMGYVVAVAVDSGGCPANFNFLIGDEYVKFQSGHAANLGAEAFAALAGTAPACTASATTAEIAFDGIRYNRAPRVLAVDAVQSQADGNSTMLILDSIAGDLSSSAGQIGSLFGLLFDDQENPYSFTFAAGCQLKQVFSVSFPRTTPRLSQVIPAGGTGWMKLWATEDRALLGAVINHHPGAAGNPGAFNQGHNLHKLTLTAAAKFTIPVVPPNCR